MKLMILIIILIILFGLLGRAIVWGFACALSEEMLEVSKPQVPLVMRVGCWASGLLILVEQRYAVVAAD